MLAVDLGATTYYVRTDGNNANNGLTDTAGGAKLTINGALAIGGLTGGDIITVGAGTFIGDPNTVVAGSSGNPIIVQGGGTGVTTVEGDVTIDQNYYTFKDFTSTGFRPFDLGGMTGIRIENILSDRPGTAVEFDSASNSIVIGCEFTRWLSNACINLSGDGNTIEDTYFHNGTEGTDVIRANGATNCTIRLNRFHDLQTPNNESGTSTDSRTTGTGSFTFNTQTGKTWQAGDFFNALYTPDESHRLQGFLTSYDSGTGVLVLEVNNVAGGSGLTYADWTLELVNAGNHSDIVQAFGSVSHDIVFERNHIENNDGQLGNFEGDGDIPVMVYNWTFRNNVFYNSRIQCNVFEDVYNFYFYNNTIYNWSGNTGFGTDEVVVCYNNIFCRVGTISTGGPYNFGNGTKDYNFMSMYATDGIKSGYVYNGTTQLNEEHGINTGTWDPYEVFTDPDNGDLTLKAGSPAIASGTDLSGTGFSNDYDGNTRSAPWDMGAYAYESSPASSGGSVLSGNAGFGGEISIK